MKQTIWAAGVACLLLAALLPVGGNGQVDFRVADSYDMAAGWYTPHDPIYIQGDRGFTARNGVVGGRGTWSDPYRIAGWEINASQEIGIHIRSTDAYFVIADCWVHGGGEEHDGINLNGVSNAVISDTIVSDNDYGVDIRHGYHCTVRNVNATGNDWGILLSDGYRNRVVNCSADRNTMHGIRVGDSNYTVVAGNTAHMNEWGIFLETCKDCFVNSNAAHGNTVHGFRCDECANLSLQDNVATDNEWGLLLSFCSHCFVADNRLASSRYGLRIDDSTDNVISHNDLIENEEGLLLLNASYNTVNSNNVTWNDDGIIITSSSSHNIVMYNTIAENMEGLSLYRETLENLLYCNNVVDNGQQAYDGCKNEWDNGSIGNYWSDYTGADMDDDGIGDTPYPIAGGAMDDYPSMSRLGPVWLPLNLTVVLPREGSLYYRRSIMPLPFDCAAWLGDLWVEARVQGGDTVERVEFYLGDTLYHTATEPSTEGLYTWRCNMSSLGLYRLQVVAYTSSGNVARDMVRLVWLNL